VCDSFGNDDGEEREGNAAGGGRRLVSLSLSMLEWKTSFVKHRFALDSNIIKYTYTTQVDLQSL
jgi:hypothetical protein